MAGFTVKNCRILAQLSSSMGVILSPLMGLPHTLYRNNCFYIPWNSHVILLRLFYISLKMYLSFYSTGEPIERPPRSLDPLPTFTKVFEPAETSLEDWVARDYRKKGTTCCRSQTRAENTFIFCRRGESLYVFLWSTNSEPLKLQR